MEIQKLATAVTVLLAPCLPYLLASGGKVMEEAAKDLGADAWALARSTWDLVHPTIKGKPSADEAVRDVASAPENRQARNALAWQIEKLLKEEPELATNIGKLLGQAPCPTIAITASGSRSVAGYNIIGSNVNTGSPQSSPVESDSLRQEKSS